MSHSDRARELATLLQLLHRAREAASTEELGFIIVNESMQLLPYRQAALWQEGLVHRVRALSGLADPDAQAPYVQWLDRLLAHIGQTRPGDTALPLQAEDVPEDIARDWPEHLPAHALWLRLEGFGSLLLARDVPWTDYELRLSEELAHGQAHALQAFLPRHPWHQQAATWLRPGAKRTKLLLGLLALCFVPVRLSVLARAEVVPQDPVLLRSPLSGVIADIHVQPNQAVQKDAPLFSLDATALSGQYAMAARERDAAQEAFRASAQLAVTDDKNKQAVAQERARLEEKSIALDYTGRELQRLRVNAPSAGVVVFSDRNDWQGRAVAVGEKVMTLANPAHVTLTAWLPAAEAIDVQAGAAITLYPNASPTQSFDAEVIRMAYKAEPVDGGLLAYRIQARFNHPGDVPRLGQMGTARVYGQWVPLIYYVLRRPLTALRQTLGW